MSPSAQQKTPGPWSPAYAHSFQIELVWRFERSELGMQSPHLETWEAREKLLLIARLSFAFLLSLLDPSYEPLRLWLLRRYDHRTGRGYRRVRAPLYRLRRALSRLWQQYPPSFEAVGPPRVLRVRVTLVEEEPLGLPAARLAQAGERAACGSRAASWKEEWFRSALGFFCICIGAEQAHGVRAVKRLRPLRHFAAQCQRGQQPCCAARLLAPLPSRNGFPDTIPHGLFSPLTSSFVKFGMTHVLHPGRSKSRLAQHAVRRFASYGMLS